jgi:hypothetical protein
MDTTCSDPALSASSYGALKPVGGRVLPQDLTEDSGNVFAARLAQQFLTGVQLGWMSLGGNDNQVSSATSREDMGLSRATGAWAAWALLNPVRCSHDEEWSHDYWPGLTMDLCGAYAVFLWFSQDPAMGLFDLLMDPAQDAAAAFVATLSQARSSLGGLFFDGRSSRDLPLSAAAAMAASVATGDRAGHRAGGQARKGSSQPAVSLKLKRSSPHGRGTGGKRTSTLPRHGGVATTAAAAGAAAGARAGETAEDQAGLNKGAAATAGFGVGIEYDAVRGAVWVDDAFDASKGLTVLLVAVEAPVEGQAVEAGTGANQGANQGGSGEAGPLRASASSSPWAVTFALDAPRYGLAGLGCEGQVTAVAVNLEDGEDGDALGTFGACDVALTIVMAPRSAAAVRVRAV